MQRRKDQFEVEPELFRATEDMPMSVAAGEEQPRAVSTVR